MVNHLYIFERTMPTVGIIQNGNELIYSNLDSICYKMVQSTKVKAEDINEADSIFFIRPNSSISAKIAKKAMKIGKFIVVMCDDDLFNLPSDVPNIPSRKKNLLKCMSCANILSTPNAYIAEKYKIYIKEKRSIVSNTIVSDGDITAGSNNLSIKTNDRFKIVYAAGAGHIHLFNSLIFPIIPRLKEQYGDKISFCFVGLKPDLKKMSSFFETEYIDFMPLNQYRSFMREAHFDLGLAPLDKSDFNRCKYFNKFIEYTIVGIPCIYSNVEPYTFVIKDEINGFLADNTEDSWFNTICKAIDRPTIRRSCLKGALNTLNDEFRAETIIERYRIELPEFFEKSSKNGTVISLFCDKLINIVFILEEWMYLLAFYIKKRGIIGTIKQTIDHFK